MSCENFGRSLLNHAISQILDAKAILMLTALLGSRAMIPLVALFYGDPPFGIPHVNPTIETWGAGDYTKPYEISAATIKQSGYSGLDNEIGSPTYYIDYTEPNGPDNDHKWLQSHPFY